MNLSVSLALASGALAAGPAGAVAPPLGNTGFNNPAGLPFGFGNPGGINSNFLDPIIGWPGGGTIPPMGIDYK